jgi:DNA-binding transcriptional MerR regulator
MSRDLTISAVHERTGIPVTTLRFYEKELPDFFTVHKTTGGHRRYTEESVRQFQMVKRMVETDGIRLSQIRKQLAARAPQVGDGEIRKHVDLLLSVYEAMTGEIELLRRKIELLEREVSKLRPKEAPAPSSGTPVASPEKRKRWF